MKSRKETTALLHARSHLKYILILEGSIVGLLAGIVSIIYRILLGKSESFVYQIAKLVKEDGIYLIALFLFYYFTSIKKRTLYQRQRNPTSRSRSAKSNRSMLVSRADRQDHRRYMCCAGRLVIRTRRAEHSVRCNVWKRLF